MVYTYIISQTLVYKIKKGRSAGYAEYMENMKNVYRIFDFDMKGRMNNIIQILKGPRCRVVG
jgi:hypothetical protein